MVKKKLLLIHVGMHKTGSTSIQDTLSKNNCGSEFVYLDLGTMNHNHKIFTMFTEHPERYYLNNTKSLSVVQKFNEDVQNELSQKLLENHMEKVIISGEDLINLSNNALEKMKKFFDEYFENIKVFAYVRSPESYMTSLLQQVIKSGVGFERFILENKKNISQSFNINMVYPNYKQTFEKFENIFGSENLLLKMFERERLLNQNVVLDFLQEFNIPIKSTDIITSNESISKPALSILYTIRKGLFYKIIDLTKRDINELVKLLHLLKGEKFILSEDLLNPILKEKKDDIKWLKNKLSLSSDKVANKQDGIKSEIDIILITEKEFKDFERLISISLLDESVKEKLKDFVYKINIQNNIKLFADTVEIKENIFSQLDKNLNINSKAADILREVSFAFEKINDIQTAQKVMEQAHILRPKGPVIKQKLEEYKKVLNKEILKEGNEGIKQVGHRDYVGGKWEEIGKLQFNYLVSEGLKPKDIFLDIACGSLRAGIHFINYLNKGNYLGIDKEKELIDLGIEKELGKEVSLSKSPEFVVSDKFEFNKFSKIPNYSIAQSLFTHLVEDDIKLCLKNLKEFVGDKPHKFYATFFEVDVPTEGELEYSHSHASFFYTKVQMEQFGKETGWKFKYIGDWNHPRDQKIVLFYSEV